MNKIEFPTNMNENPVNEDGSSLCNMDKTDNVWYVNGVCKLDGMSYEQIFLAASHPRIKRDLYRVTSNPVLILLANNAKSSVDEKDDNQKTVDLINDKKKTLPLYNVLKGNFDGSIY